MPVLALPASPGQIAFLCAALAGFVSFAVTLLWVSLSVTLASADEKAIERKVTPARRAAEPVATQPANAA